MIQPNVPLRPTRGLKKSSRLLLMGVPLLVVLLMVLIGTAILFWVNMGILANHGLGQSLQRADVKQGVLTLAYQNGNQNTVTNQLQPSLKLTNTGNSPISLKDVTIRYWYTADTRQAQVFACDYATIDCQNVQCKIVPMEQPRSKADTYLEISFIGGVLSPSTSKSAQTSASTEIKVRVHKTDWSNYNQNNDYSFVPAAINYSSTQQIGVYYQGKLISGSEPV